MRISGIARRLNGDTVLERTTVFAGKQEIASLEQLDPFELEVENGHRVRVELAKSLRLEPAEKRDVKWEDIESDPSLAGIHAKNAPGPHVKVRLVRSRVMNGARIELLAQDDAEHVFAVTGSHRTAPARHLARVTARAIATGDDAKGIIDRMVTPTATAAHPKHKGTKKKPPDETKASRFDTPVRRVELVIAGIGGLFLALAAWMALSPLSVDFGLLGVSLISAAALAWTLGRIPTFVSGGKRAGKLANTDPGFLFLMILMLPGTLIGITCFFDAGTPWQDPHGPAPYNGSWGSALALFLAGIAQLVAVVLRGNTEARLFRVLLGAPPLPSEGPLAGTWGSFEGIVRDPTPVTAEGEAVAIVHVVSEEIVGGSNPNIYTERVLSQGTFFIDAKDGSGRSIEVHPDGATWASSVGLRIKKERGSKTIVDHVRAVPLRGSVLLAGRAVRAGNEKVGRVEASGRESLLFVAVRAGESARNECRAMLLLRRVGAVIALATIGFSVATVVLLEPKLPKFHIPSEGAD